jgi:hypothetical protein
MRHHGGCMVSCKNLTMKKLTLYPRELSAGGTHEVIHERKKPITRDYRVFLVVSRQGLLDAAFFFDFAVITIL